MLALLPASLNYKRTTLTALITSSLTLTSPYASAADFTILDGDTVTTAQTLNDNEVGTIESGGSLNVAPTAINAAGDNISITNNGSISTTNAFASSVGSFGINATINNNGSIVSSGTGVRATGNNADIKNDGSISTSGIGAYGIQSNGSNTDINNSGSISTTGVSAYGIESTQTNTNITNSGSISTTNTTSFGIRSTGTNVNIINSGTISTTNTNAGGISGFSSNASITNSGIITTTGDNAFGIDSTGADASITNSGTITTTGDNAHGINSTGNSATIENSGKISATGAGSHAVFGTANDITLNLRPGSQIIGSIDLGSGADNDTVNIYGGSLSANLTFTNVENINVFGAGVVNGNMVTTVEATGESSRSVTLSSITTSIHGVVSQRMSYTQPLKPIQVVSLELSPGMLFQERKPVAWAQAFGGNYDRDAQGGAIAYDADHFGFTLGYEWDINDTRVGLMGGVVNSETQTQTTSFKTEADSYYVGAYGHFNLGSVHLTTSLLGGYSDHDNERLVVDNIAGTEMAKSDMDSTFISPSVTLSSAYVLADRIEFRPSASINYSVAWLDSYRETGTTNANLKVDDRTVKVLMAKLQVAAAYQLDNRSEFEFRVGVSSRHSDDDDTDVSIGGGQFSYANAGDENVSGSYAGVNLRIAAQDNLSLVADMEFGGGSDEDYVNAQMTLEYTF